MESVNFGQQQGFNPAILLDSPNVVCKCGSKVFHQSFVLKKLSALVSPTGREEVIEIPVFVCDKCGEIPDVYKQNKQYEKIFGESSESKNKLN